MPWRGPADASAPPPPGCCCPGSSRAYQRRTACAAHAAAGSRHGCPAASGCYCSCPSWRARVRGPLAAPVAATRPPFGSWAGRQPGPQGREGWRRAGRTAACRGVQGSTNVVREAPAASSGARRESNTCQCTAAASGPVEGSSCLLPRPHALAPTHLSALPSSSRAMRPLAVMCLQCVMAMSATNCTCACACSRLHRMKAR